MIMLYKLSMQRQDHCKQVWRLHTQLLPAVAFVVNPDIHMHLYLFN